MRLLDELAGYADPALVEFIATEKTRLSRAIHAEKRAETLIEREWHERFE
jgi:hypothetical protein